MKPLEFWFEFGSTYSYLSAMRIDALAATRDVPVDWRPFLLGPIFKAFGWNTSPFLIYPQKGVYMWRDMERRAARLGLPFRRPDTAAGDVFPQNGLAAARIALVGLEAGWGRDFCRAAYQAQFVEGRNIADPALLEDRAIRAGATPAELEAAVSAEIKAALRAQTDAAIAHGIFGAPSFRVGDELFWGDDRLDEAVDWAADA
jgi:2-hydroxychromene-2-carboxylate isomerase